MNGKKARLLRKAYGVAHVRLARLTREEQRNAVILLHSSRKKEEEEVV